MLKKQDHDFFEILEDPSKIEKRLSELANQRLLFGISAAMTAIVFFAILFMLLAANLRFVGLSNQPSIAGPVSGCLTMGVALATSLARAIGAHGEIRTLLVFKKLRDMYSSD